MNILQNQDELVSIITPSNNSQFLIQAWRSLRAQTYKNWEWIVLLNNGAEWNPDIKDSRVRISSVASVSGVGQAKKIAAESAIGTIILELDHDDVLASNAVEIIVTTFSQNPNASMVYSDAAGIDTNGDLVDVRYAENLGWMYRQIVVDNQSAWYPITFEPTPHNISYIWFAPNHVRAFSRTHYEEVGGYNENLQVLDDQDLMSKLFQRGRFVHIPECLYFQRVHDGNTQSKPNLNAEIQSLTLEIYDREVEQNVLAWAHREGLLALDMGAAHNKQPGYLGVDQTLVDGVDVVCKLPDTLPFADNSVGLIRAFDFLEHVADKVALINEFYRVLAPGGMLISRTPSTDGRGAFQDPTHVAYYNQNSFLYYTQESYRRFVPEILAAFQISRIYTLFPTDTHQLLDIPYVQANLIALKPGVSINGGIIGFSNYRIE